LPVYGEVPDFSLTDQSGRALRRADLAAKVWIASFIFTTCPDECPLMTAEIARLQKDLAGVPDLRFVSISVDPERDTPAVLARYANDLQADPERWFFLTGDKRAIYGLVREGFRLGVIDPAAPSHPPPAKHRSLSEGQRSWRRSPQGSVSGTSAWFRLYLQWWRFVEPPAAFADHGRGKDPLHSTRFVLIDRQSRIRGYYESREEAALLLLRQHLVMLLQET
jgi:cytochrome oxidase Cu insertion factor (SCO1/SenC/PrrC family)